MNRVLQRIKKEHSMNNWSKRMMDMAYLVGTWSKDPRTKVGCVIADDKHRVLGVGYNGFPRGVVDYPSRYADKETKLMMVKHAEENAVFNCTASTEDAFAYVTLAPCSSCAGTLIQAGIKRVIFPEYNNEYANKHCKSLSLMYDMFKEANVYTNIIDQNGELY